MSPMPAVDAEFLADLSRGSSPLLGLKQDELPGLRAGMLEASRAATVPAGIEREDIVVPGASGQPDVVMRIHRPRGASGALPCIFAIHGGGFVLGTYEVEDQRLGSWAERLGAVGVSVEYRLAPETAYPGALDDCFTGLRWVFEQASDLQIDPRRTGTMGTSAGAGLAIAAALRARDTGAGFMPAFQLLSYPMIDDRRATRSSHWDAVPVWDPPSNDFAWRSYLGDLYGAPDVPGYAAPARVKDFRGLPPTFLSVGTADVVFDETVALAQELVHSGVSTDLRVHAGAPHGMDRRATATWISRNTRREMLAWLSHRISTSAEIPHN